jgi:hypothetical protein
MQTPVKTPTDNTNTLKVVAFATISNVKLIIQDKDCIQSDHQQLSVMGKQPEDVNWISFWYGSLAGLYPWFVIFMFMTSSPGVNKAPWFVWVILGTYIFMFNTFPWTMCCPTQWQRLAWRPLQLRHTRGGAWWAVAA